MQSSFDQLDVILQRLLTEFKEMLKRSKNDLRYKFECSNSEQCTKTGECSKLDTLKCLTCFS